MADNRDIAGPVIRWQNYGYEGWKPSSFPTIETALRAEHYGNDFIITRVANYRIVEITTYDTADPLPQTMEASNGR